MLKAKSPNMGTLLKKKRKEKYILLQLLKLHRLQRWSLADPLNGLNVSKFGRPLNIRH